MTDVQKAAPAWRIETRLDGWKIISVNREIDMNHFR
jgi:hypothetical protein